MSTYLGSPALAQTCVSAHVYIKVNFPGIVLRQHFGSRFLYLSWATVAMIPDIYFYVAQLKFFPSTKWKHWQNFIYSPHILFGHKKLPLYFLNDTDGDDWDKMIISRKFDNSELPFLWIFFRKGFVHYVCIRVHYTS